jgi:hypothetical protein
MKCEIIYGPEAGTTKHFPNNDPTAHMLIKSGMLRLVENEPGELVKAANGQIIPKMQAAPEARWFVGWVATHYAASALEPAANVGKVPAIVFEFGTTVHEHYTGDPKESWQGFGKRQIPADILKQYAQAYKEFYGR